MLSKLAMDRPVMALPASSIADDWGQGRDDAGRTSDTSSAAAQYGGSERTTYGQTGGYPDPTTRRDWQGAATTAIPQAPEKSLQLPVR